MVGTPPGRSSAPGLVNNEILKLATKGSQTGLWSIYVWMFYWVLVPGAAEPIRFTITPETVFAWENLLVSGDFNQKGWVTIRVENEGLYRIPKNVGFRTLYKGLPEGNEPFNFFSVTMIYPHLKQDWLRGYIEITDKGEISKGSLMLTEYYSWGKYFQKTKTW